MNPARFVVDNSVVMAWCWQCRDGPAAGEEMHNHGLTQTRKARMGWLFRIQRPLPPPSINSLAIPGGGSSNSSGAKRIFL